MRHFRKPPQLSGILKINFLNGESNNIERFIASFGVYCAVAHLPWLQAIALATSVGLRSVFG